MSRRRLSSRRWLAWAISVLILTLVLPLTTVGLAQAAPQPLEEAVSRALDEAGQPAPNGVHVVPVVERQGWSFGTVALLGTARGDGPPEVVLYVAERDGASRRAAVESSDDYQRLLRQAPAGMIPEVVLPAREAVSGQAWDNKTNLPLSIPFGSGINLILENGPHVDYQDRPDARPRSAIDFAHSTEGVTIFPAAPGFAMTPCAGPPGNPEGTPGGPLVIIQHENGRRRSYFHMYGTQPLNKSVRRGDAIGFMGSLGGAVGCEGQVFPPHLHFTPRREVAGGVHEGVDLDGV